MILVRNGIYARCLPCMQLVRSMCQCKSIIAIHRSCLIVLSSCPDTAPSTLVEARILAHTAGSSVGFGSIQQHVYGHHVVTQHPIHLYPHHPQSPSSRIRDIKHKNISSSTSRQLIHHTRYLFFQYHRADCRPS